MRLRPTLWRTCRVIACETRLHLLWEIFENNELCVGELADLAEITHHNASTQLRALNARGLLVATRRKQKLFYRPEANEDVAHAEDLLKALHRCYEQSVPFKQIIRQATAFTHTRRIEIVQELSGCRKTFADLLQATGMKPPSLSRHLEKLKARGFVEQVDKMYKLRSPRHKFGRVLLRIARS